ncbi:MAG: hypothetical protein D6706_06990 [Chloroflexi bacterium]|nr:MAG: hypothetical protein D6706_06990 [Chloroflexota bacterium]
MSLAELEQLLQVGELEVEGLLPWSSNYTFLVRVCHDGVEVSAVYKPRRGERPLWDFPHGTLCQRERAAWIISEAIGWHIVPPTVIRTGPHGIGSVQLFIEHDPENHYFTFEGDPQLRTQVQKIVLFDTIINNADRKSGHVLRQPQQNNTPDRLWAIDHGVCFHTDYKLRTVIWEFAGQPIPSDLMQDLKQFQQRWHTAGQPWQRQLETLLSPAELNALENRLAKQIQQQTFIQPGPGRHYPWPPV